MEKHATATMLAATLSAVEASAARAAEDGSLGIRPFLGPVDRMAAMAGGAMELAGVAIVVLGAVLTTAAFVRRLARGDKDEAWQEFRSDLGRAILLGLEFLVAADIIGSVAVDPSFRSLGGLAMLVLIRTFLSFTLEVEITGRWPWRKGGEGREK